MRSLFCVVVIASILTACNGSSEKRIVGSWEFENPKLDKTIVFTTDNKCYALNAADGKVDTGMTGTYKMLNDKKLITTDNGDSRIDTVDILELTAGNLKIKTPGGDTVLLKKK